MKAQSHSGAGRVCVRGFAVVLLALLPIAVAQPARGAFAQKVLEISNQQLFDLGVADFNADGALDVFSTNHKYRGSLLAGNGAGGFTGAFDISGISATANIPGFDDLNTDPVIATKGLYIWIDAKDLLHIRTLGLGTIPQIPLDRVKGSISYTSRDAFVRKSQGATLSVDNSGDNGKVTFDAGANSHVIIYARFMDLEIEMQVERLFPRQRILLGPRLSHPPDHDFRVKLGDRHGIAWADFNSDNILDAYIANGGEKGRVSRFGALSADQLYMGRGDGTFADRIAETQISKGFCRGRYAAPVDYDADGDLDLMVGCEDRSPILFMQRIPGRYGSRSHLLAAVRARADIYRWLDIEQDRRPELIAIHRRKIAIYGLRGEEYVRRSQVRSPSQGKLVDDATVGDPDRDGDADIFVASRGGNSLLRNTGQRFSIQKPGRLGLPVKGSISATWLDYDNDGLLDLHAYPQGLYRQTESGRFEATGLLQTGKRAVWAAANFADIDSDGDRDLVTALKQHGRRAVRTLLFTNQTPGAGHWLELDLVGPRGNPQAVGAQVTVVAGGSKQTGWVAQSEGSRYSTGHYRLYYGLGRAAQAEVTVTWPDETTSRFGPLAADSRYALVYGTATPYEE